VRRIAAEARDLEDALYNDRGAGCARCHDVERAASGPGRWAVIPPRIPSRYAVAT